MRIYYYVNLVYIYFKYYITIKHIFSIYNNIIGYENNSDT